MQAFKLSAGAFIIPFMFVYSPSLLLQGDWSEFLIHFPPALVGIVAVAGTLVGYVRRPLPLLARAVLFAAGLMMIIPDLLVTATGFALIVPVALQQWGVIGRREASTTEIEQN